MAVYTDFKQLKQLSQFSDNIVTIEISAHDSLRLINDNAAILIVIESGGGVVSLGKTEETTESHHPVFPGNLILIPANTFYKIVNVGELPLKGYSMPICCHYQPKKLAL